MMNGETIKYKDNRRTNSKYCCHHVVMDCFNQSLYNIMKHMAI